MSDCEMKVCKHAAGTSTVGPTSTASVAIPAGNYKSPNTPNFCFPQPSESKSRVEEKRAVNNQSAITSLN